jgi:hypothetical protein
MHRTIHTKKDKTMNTANETLNDFMDCARANNKDTPLEKDCSRVRIGLLSSRPSIPKTWNCLRLRPVSMRLSTRDIPKTWPEGTRRWDLRFECEVSGQELRSKYFTGPAAQAEPDAREILAMWIDAARAGLETFEHYCFIFGANPDSREAERTWKQCRRIKKGLESLLGGDLVTVRSSEV